MNAKLLTDLLAGQFICEIAFEQEYELLSDPEVRAEVELWLASIDRRLAQLGEDGAYFVAPMQIMAPHAAKVREDLKRFRDVYGPSVRMLNLIREAKDGFSCSPGDYVQLADIEGSINESSTLESHLRSMHSAIAGVSIKHSNREFLKRMLENLTDSGYLVLSNPQNETYRVTGKIDHLHAALEFISEHEPVIASAPEDEAQTEDLVLKATLQTGESDV
ncbi:MAG: hypothetical protein Q8R06_22075 [Polaromonas sp.]|uniref:hypothetical protein n=1 Tax=Polaromonas sp. TaxID=1869339 RepID=UPI0027338459|nr:hypothetical protein [Polaromonas sp.]MDP3799795.1 hypothetical protein [Polaromonas sp.]